MEKFSITKIKGSSMETADAQLVEEVPLTIISGDHELATFLCTPLLLDELILGFLFTSGLISHANDVNKIGIDRKSWTAYVELSQPNPILAETISKRVYTSGCGRGIFYTNAFDFMKRKDIVTSDLQIKCDHIFTLMKKFLNASKQFPITGGIHSAGLASEMELLLFSEDIGRHNAIDKIIGSALKKNISTENKILLTTGRISSEVLFKIQKATIPIIASRSAPSNHAVRLAQQMNITTAGFVRGKSMNIYSGPHRITT